MDFTGLRNSVEHIAAVYRGGAPEDPTEAESAENNIVADAVLVIGQCLVSGAESLHDIARSLRVANHEEEPNA